VTGARGQRSSLVRFFRPWMRGTVLAPARSVQVCVPGPGGTVLAPARSVQVCVPGPGGNGLRSCSQVAYPEHNLLPHMLLAMSLQTDPAVSRQWFLYRLYPGVVHVFLKDLYTRFATFNRFLPHMLLAMSLQTDPVAPGQWFLYRPCPVVFPISFTVAYTRFATFNRFLPHMLLAMSLQTDPAVSRAGVFIQAMPGRVPYILYGCIHPVCCF
jgi:hypothetical protein